MCCRKYKKHDDLKSVEKDVVTNFIKDEAESSSNDCDADLILMMMKKMRFLISIKYMWLPCSV